MDAAVPSHLVDPPAIVRQAPDLQPAGRGGLLLPHGWLSTSGSQIIDAAGRPMRIASIGWNGTEGPPGAAPSGIWTVSYKTVLNSIVAAGFNAVRIPWTDLGLNAPLNGYSDRLGWINTTLNPELLASDTPNAQGRYRYVTTLVAFQRIVDYAGEIGLKVIFNHHTNQGTAGQQRNGLWFDLGPGTNNTDGIVPGRFAAQDFKQNWLRVAKTFAGNPTVIGYDLHNEPNGDRGHITWGGGGPTDIKAMCEDVGSAIQDVEPQVLIICEGPETYKPPPASSGMDPRHAAPAGNLTAAGANPVRLKIPNKLVYSIHEYPEEIADTKRWGNPGDRQGFHRSDEHHLGLSGARRHRAGVDRRDGRVAAHARDARVGAQSDRLHERQMRQGRRTELHRRSAAGQWKLVVDRTVERSAVRAPDRMGHRPLSPGSDRDHRRNAVSAAQVEQVSR